MTFERQMRIAHARQMQPLQELERKARKAATRARLHTQEGLDLAGRRAYETWQRLRVE